VEQLFSALLQTPNKSSFSAFGGPEDISYIMDMGVVL